MFMRFAPNQLLLYKLFLSYPDRAFYMQEIGRILGKKPGVFQRTLYTLEEDGFVTSVFKANARFFSLNKEYPVLRELHSIIRKVSPEINVFKNSVRDLDARPRSPASRKFPDKTVPTTPPPAPRAKVAAPAKRPEPAKPAPRKNIHQLELF